MIPANFDYESPRTLSEALELLASREDAKILAGGHSLLPAMKLRLAQPALLVDIGRIGGLSYVRESGEHIRIEFLGDPRVLCTGRLHDQRDGQGQQWRDGLGHRLDRRLRPERRLRHRWRLDQR